MDFSFKQFFMPHPTAAVINSILCCFLIISILTALYHIFRYMVKERLFLNKVRKRINEHFETSIPDSEKSTDEENKNEQQANINQFLIDEDVLKEGLSRNSIIYQRIISILQVKHFNIKVNTETLKQEIQNSEASKTSINLPGLITNLSMTLGLFGTFIGLSIMVFKIGLLLPETNATDFSISSLRDSIANMEILFNGIYTAFSTSIVGMFSSMVSYILTFFLKQKQMSFFRDLENFSTEKLIPAILPMHEENFLIAVSNRMQDSFEKLNDIWDSNQSALQELNTIHDQLSSIYDQFKNIISEIRKTLRREETENIGEVLIKLTESNDLITNLMGELPKIFKTMDSYGKHIENKVDELERLQKKRISPSSNENKGSNKTPLIVFLVFIILAQSLYIIL